MHQDVAFVSSGEIDVPVCGQHAIKQAKVGCDSFRVVLMARRSQDKCAPICFFLFEKGNDLPVIGK